MLSNVSVVHVHVGTIVCPLNAATDQYATAEVAAPGIAIAGAEDVAVPVIVKVVITVPFTTQYTTPVQFWLKVKVVGVLVTSNNPVRLVRLVPN
jgi:hypothetical protein